MGLQFHCGSLKRRYRQPLARGEAAVVASASAVEELSGLLLHTHMERGREGEAEREGVGGWGGREILHTAMHTNVDHYKRRASVFATVSSTIC